MLNSKFVRAHFVNVSQTTTTAMRWTFKLIYEFWGFCVNGGNSLSVPGGFASSGSISPLSGAVIFPSQFESGSTVLLMSGSDGQTDDGMPFFNTSSPVFSSTYVGKHIVTWKSGSTSTDDSIYQITQWINSSSIRVKILNGGTPYTASLHPGFTQRSNVNYRVIDLNAAAGLSGFTTNDGLVLQFNGAGLVNTGQLNSQCRLRCNNANLGVTTSPSGSWTPSSGTFTDPTSESNINWYNSITGTGYISLWGAQDYLLVHSKGTWNSAASWLHVEIPARLYPQSLDPNLICSINVAADSVDQTSYEASWVMMHPPDGTTRTWTSYIRNPTGDTFSAHYTSPAGAFRGQTNGRYNNSMFNVFTNKMIFVDAVLGLPSVSQQYCMSRARARRVRFTVPIVPTYHRIGDQGQWIHINNGVLWPWDNTVLPFALLLGGN